MTDTSPAPAETPPKRLTLRQTVAYLRGAIDRADPGTLAALRRSRPETSPPAVFYRFVIHALPEDASLSERDELAWATVVALMAKAKGSLSDVPFGAALARANIAEIRVFRLLEASPAQLPDLARGIVHQLVQKGQSFDPLGLASLLLANEDQKNPRSAIARDFYRHADK